MIATSPSSSLRPGDDDLERRLVTFLVGRVRDPLAVVVREPHRADRAVERDARDGERGRRAVDRRDVVRVLQVDTEDGRDDLHLVAEVGRERRAQRPVGEARGEDRVLARATFAAEERAGDLARGVRALLDVDGEREEVDALAGLRRAHGGEHRGVADAHDDRAVGEFGEAAGFEGHLEAGGVDGTADADDGLSRRIAHGREPLLSGARGSGSQLSASWRAFARRALATDNRRRSHGFGNANEERTIRSSRKYRYRRMPSLAMIDRYRSTSLRLK